MEHIDEENENGGVVRRAMKLSLLHARQRSFGRPFPLFSLFSGGGGEWFLPSANDKPNRREVVGVDLCRWFWETFGFHTP